MEKTAGGLDENVAGALTYLMGWITGLGFLLFEPNNSFVRFHARQSVIVFGGLSIAWFVAVTIPLIGWFFAFFVIPYLSVGLWLFLMFKAYKGQRIKLPYVGDLAERA
jgi:uncharacterized membrane protein